MMPSFGTKMLLPLLVVILARNILPAAGTVGIQFGEGELDSAQLQQAKNILHEMIRGFKAAFQRIRSTPLVYLSVQDELYSVDPTNLQSEVAAKIDEGFIVAIDYDAADEFVYWRTSIGTLQRMKRDGTERETVMTDIGGAGGIGIDWVTKNMYWTDEALNQISVVSLEGNFQKVLIKNDIDGPRGIAVNPEEGKFYWTEWKSNPRIASASLDGSNIVTLVDKDIVWPNGIAIDYFRRMIYFADAGRDKIEVMKTDGTDRKVLLEKQTPHVFALSHVADHLYWTDWLTERAERINVTDISDRETIKVSSRRMMAIKATYSLKLFLTNSCEDSNGRCTHFCFYTGQNVTCGCPDDEDTTCVDV